MKLSVALLVILLGSFFFRAYRTADFLGFWFDQGRDAKEVWDFLYVDHKPFLVGPTTGIEGIFLGPFYYYLITPFYLLGHGDPVYPAVGLAVISTVAVFLIYKVASDYFGRQAGLLAAFLYGFAYHIIIYNRWLSNPAPLPLFAILAFWSLLKIISGSTARFHWILLALNIGLSLQLEAASAIFFLPATALTLFLNRKSLRMTRISILSSVFVFVLTLLPQIVFNLRHENILVNSFIRFLVTESSFQLSLTDLLRQRLAFYYEIFTNKFFFYVPSTLAFVTITAVFGVFVSKWLNKKVTIALLVWILTPVLILLFYHGNNGYVWDYYFTGVYPCLFILVAAVWSTSLRHLRVGPPAILILLMMFIFQNIRNSLNFVSQPLPGYISLTPIIQSVDWIYEDAADTPFNTDVYVPPIISHAYDYVFIWRGTTKYKNQPTGPLVKRLYTIIEPDYVHPQLRDGWMVRQAGLSSIETEHIVGPLLVQRRHRFSTLP